MGKMERKGTMGGGRGLEAAVEVGGRRRRRLVALPRRDDVVAALGRLQRWDGAVSGW